MKKILLISGQIDISSTGNQTFKNTILYLAKARFRLDVFTFVPSDYPNLLDPYKIFMGFDHITFHRLPKVLNFLFRFARTVKNRVRKKESLFKIEDNVEYFSDYDFSAKAIYCLSWIFYVFLEIPRIFISCLKQMPDLFYGYEIYGARVASILGAIFQRPVVTRFQGTVLDIQRRNSWKYLPHQVWGLKSSASAVIMGNDGTRGDEVLIHLGVPRDKIRFWMNGLDQSTIDFSPCPKEIERLRSELNIGNKRVIISVNRLILWKRTDRIIHTVYKLINDHRITDIALLVVGSGAERQNLQRLVDSYDISDSVIFLDGIPHDHIGNYFLLSDVFLNTSDVTNLGNQLLEALHFGCPIVTLKDRSTEEILKDGYNSILVSRKDIEENLAKAVCRILTDRNLSRRLRFNAKVTADKKVMSWGKRMQKEINLITRLIESKK